MGIFGKGVISSIFTNNYKTYEGVFDYYFINDIKDKLKRENVFTFDFLNLREVINRVMNSTIVVFELDTQIPYPEFIIPVLHTINSTIAGYFVLISDYRVYGNTIVPKDENDEACGYGSIPNFLYTVEEFVKRNFKNWLIIRKPEIYGFGEENIINAIIKSHNTIGKILIPIKPNNYLPTIASKDYINILEYLIKLRINKEIVNMTNETLDLFMFKNIVSEKIQIVENNDLLTYKVNMISSKIKNFYYPQYKIKDYLADDKMIENVIKMRKHRENPVKKGGEK